MKRLLLLLLVLFVGVSTLSAKEEEKKMYTDEDRSTLIARAIKSGSVELVVEPWGGNGIECERFEKTEQGYAAKKNGRPIFCERGYSFTPVTFINGYRYIFRIDDKFYAINIGDVLVKNEEQRERYDYMAYRKSNRMLSAAGRFYGTSSALYLMLLVMGAAAVLVFLYKMGLGILRPILLIVVPVAILIFSLIEIFGFVKFGNDIFWWCEYDRYGFFGSLWRLIPFAAMVYAQVYSIKIYERVLFCSTTEDECDEEKKISLKPAVWSLLLCLPVPIVVAIICSKMGLGGSVAMEIATLVSFLLTLGLGIYISFHRNMKRFGFIVGLYVTIFSLVYILGCIISAIAMGVLVFQLIFQILVVVGAILVLMMVGSRRRVVRDGRVYEERF